MAKLVVTEVYEGTNEEIQELQDRVTQIVKSGSYKQNVGNTLVEVDTDADFDEEEEVEVEEVEETLSERLARELELLRPILSRKAIQRSEELIEEARRQEEEEDLEEEDLEEDYDDEDDCDCDCDDDSEGFVIRVIFR